MKGRAISYSDVELRYIERFKEMPRRDLHRAFVEAFDRPDVPFDAFKGLCTRKGWATGRSGCFEKGQTPVNKGRRMPSNAASAACHFKPGRLPHNTRHIGAERISKDGYIEVSIAERNPHTGADRRFVQKHRWLWEKENGPVPVGMCLKSRDGDKMNTDPGNWIAIPRALLPRLNGRFGRNYDAAPPELKPAILATARLEYAAREARKGDAREDGPTCPTPTTCAAHGCAEQASAKRGG